MYAYYNLSGILIYMFYFVLAVKLNIILKKDAKLNIEIQDGIERIERSFIMTNSRFHS
jgi:hypothetical protein